jgi:3-dehydroquinate synthase
VTVETLTVDTGRQRYDILIGSGLIGRTETWTGLPRSAQAVVVTNDTIAPLWADRLVAALAPGYRQISVHGLPDGESHKDWPALNTVFDHLLERGCDRKTVIYALGGGVVGDMAGFAAATWLRGIAVVQGPTTLLAMVDAAIGGKTGVNHPGGKNLIGAFHQPRLVLIDPTTLATLPEREFRAGMAEVIKYGVIGDLELFAALESAGSISAMAAVSPELLQELLERSATAKAKVVAADEHEGGLRAILNYGHTLGHVVETLCGYGTWLHGEAVAIGMAAAGAIAVEMGLWSTAEQQRQLALIQAAGLPVHWPDLDQQVVLECLQGDKKVRDGRVRFVLPTTIGGVQIRDDVTAATIGQALISISP